MQRPVPTETAKPCATSKHDRPVDVSRRAPRQTERVPSATGVINRALHWACLHPDADSDAAGQAACRRYPFTRSDESMGQMLRRPVMLQ